MSDNWDSDIEIIAEEVQDELEKKDTEKSEKSSVTKAMKKVIQHGGAIWNGTANRWQTRKKKNWQEPFAVKKEVVEKLLDDGYIYEDGSLTTYGSQLAEELANGDGM